MPSQRQIAKDWGCAPSYVAKCVKRGCPTDSYETARKWREDNASRRAPTDQKSIARQVAEEREDDSPEARARRKSFLEEVEGDPEYATIPTLPKLPDGDPLEIARLNSQHAANEAWRLLSEAMLSPEKTSSISMLLAIHTKAIEAMIDTEVMIREELERRGVIIDLDEAKEMARKGYHIMISRLSALPLNVGPRCNPHDPHHATNILQTECIGIITDAQKAFAA